MTAHATAPGSNPDADDTEGHDHISGDGIEYLTFVTHDRRFAAPITEVREIRNWSTPTTVPHAPAHLLGVVNLRGTVLPVVDLALRLGIGPTPDKNRNVFVVVEIEDRPIGLLVEAVSDILVPAAEDRQPLPEGGGFDGGLVEGLILIEDGMIQILRLSALDVLDDMPTELPRALAQG